MEPRTFLCVLTAAVLCACGSNPPPAARPTAQTDYPRPPSSTPEPSTSAPDAPTPVPDSPAPSKPALPLKIVIKLEPRNPIATADSKDLMLSFEVTNTGKEAIDSELEGAQLEVNGKPNKGFHEALMEVKTDKWKSMKPGDTIRFHYRLSQKAVVKPGEYNIRLKVGGTASDAVKLVVEP